MNAYGSRVKWRTFYRCVRDKEVRINLMGSLKLWPKFVMNSFPLRRCSCTIEFVTTVSHIATVLHSE